MIRLGRFAKKRQRRGVIKVETESKVIIFLSIGFLLILGLGLGVQNELVKSKNTTIKSEVVLEGTESNKVKEDEEKTEKTDEEKSKEDSKEETVANITTPVPTIEPTPTPTPDPIVYDGLTMNQLAEKLDRSLNSTIAGKGYTFASESLALGIDPYLAVAIVLHETGCSWDCSYLVKACNNVGGMKGSPGCNGGSYAAFSSLDDGIRSYLSNLYRNYYAYGLNTPETIGPKYAASTSWSSKVNWYISSIRNK